MTCAILRSNLLVLLKGGDRTSIGRSDHGAATVSANPKLFPALIVGLASDDPLVRMRVADAAEKVTRTAAELLQPYRKQLLALMAETQEPELRWHLAAMVPRLRLNTVERRRVATLLRSYLNDDSSIVKTFALQGLADLARRDRKLLTATIRVLRQARRSGTPAMKARSRKLLLLLGCDR